MLLGDRRPSAGHDRVGDRNSGAPADVILSVDGKGAARTTVKRTVPAAFTASETFDVGIDLGSPVSLDYFDRRPFAFTGKIEKVDVELK